MNLNKKQYVMHKLKNSHTWELIPDERGMVHKMICQDCEEEKEYNGADAIQYPVPLLMSGVDLPEHKIKYSLMMHDSTLGIKCHECGFTSWNPNDVKNRYCGNCHKYLDDFFQHNFVTTHS